MLSFLALRIAGICFLFCFILNVEFDEVFSILSKVNEKEENDDGKEGKKSGRKNEEEEESEEDAMGKTNQLTNLISSSE